MTEFRFGYNRYAQNLGLAGDQTPLANALGLSNFNNNLASINIAGLGTLGAPAYYPERPIDNTFNWNWNWNYVSSMHRLKWGVDIRRIRSDGFLDAMAGTPLGVEWQFQFRTGRHARQQ